MPDAAPTLTFEIERAEHQIVVHCHGKLTSTVSENFYTDIKPLLAQTHRLVLDLTDLTHMDSLGLGTLVRLYVHARGVHCELVLINLGKQVRHLLGLTHMLDIFTVVGEHGIRLG
jgi:anti-sigma B factor antagonist